MIATDRRKGWDGDTAAAEPGGERLPYAGKVGGKRRGWSARIVVIIIILAGLVTSSWAGSFCRAIEASARAWSHAIGERTTALGRLREVPQLLKGDTEVGAGRIERREFRSTHMGTEFKFLLYSNDVRAARDAAQTAFDRIAALDRAFSDYNPESELMRLSDRAGSGPIPVSLDLWQILTQSQELYRDSAGAFDVTVGPVVRLWRRARRTKELPDAATLAKARERVGGRWIQLGVQLDPEKRTVTLQRAGIKLDLGGIAKGYAVDAAYAILTQRGFDRLLVAAAGDIRVGNPPPDEPGWDIAIAEIDPLPVQAGVASPSKFTPKTPIGPRLRLKNAAVSTSGDTAQFVIIGGVRYSHIVDPRTGTALTRHGQVTVIAPKSTLADGCATAAAVLGPADGAKFMEKQPGCSARFVEATAAGEIVTMTPGFSQALRPTDATDATDATATKSPKPTKPPEF